MIDVSGWRKRQIALDQKAENAREMGLNYDPEHEPVCDKDPQGCWNVRCQLGKKCKNTPTQRIWVGLTDAEIKDILDCGRSGLVDIKKTEAKLKEKNT